jgi:hypothetical protein
MKDLSQIVLVKTALWLSSMDEYFDIYPGAVNVFVSFLQNDQERLNLAIIGINKINEGFGFSIENPLAEIAINGCYGMFDLLELAVLKRKSHYKYLKQGFIIDEFDLQTKNGENFKMYNRVEAQNSLNSKYVIE